MNDLAALAGTPAMTALLLIRVQLIVVMIASLVIRNRAVRGSRARYRASTVLRATVIPVTILATVGAAVSLAAGEWWDGLAALFLLAAMPVYFKLAEEEDDWWTGRWTKIRKGITAAFKRPATAPAHQH